MGLFTPGQQKNRKKYNKTHKKVIISDWEQKANRACGEICQVPVASDNPVISGHANTEGRFARDAATAHSCDKKTNIERHYYCLEHVSRRHWKLTEQVQNGTMDPEGSGQNTSVEWQKCISSVFIVLRKTKKRYWKFAFVSHCCYNSNWQKCISAWNYTQCAIPIDCETRKIRDERSQMHLCTSHTAHATPTELQEMHISFYALCTDFEWI